MTLCLAVLSIGSMGMAHSKPFFIPWETWHPRASPISHVVTSASSTTTEQREKTVAFCQVKETGAETLVLFKCLLFQFWGVLWA